MSPPYIYVFIPIQSNSKTTTTTPTATTATTASYSCFYSLLLLFPTAFPYSLLLFLIMTGVPFKIVGICGSLRSGSFNRLLLNAAQKYAPAGVEIEILDYSKFPLYNQDHESDLPESVKNFKAKVVAADAVLFVTPEFNYSIPGPLKNAIDWGSRPWGTACWTGKPVGIMGAGPGKYPGTSATIKAQNHLRSIVIGFDMIPVQKPEVTMPAAGDNFNEKGELTNEYFQGVVAGHMKALVRLVKLLRLEKEYLSA